MSGGSAADALRVPQIEATSSPYRDCPLSFEEISALRTRYLSVFPSETEHIAKETFITEIVHQFGGDTARNPRFLAGRLFDVFLAMNGSEGMTLKCYSRGVAKFSPNASVQAKAKVLHDLMDVQGNGNLTSHVLLDFLTQLTVPFPVTLSEAQLSSCVALTFQSLALPITATIQPEHIAKLVARSPRILDFVILPLWDIGVDLDSTALANYSPSPMAPRRPILNIHTGDPVDDPDITPRTRQVLQRVARLRSSMAGSVVQLPGIRRPSVAPSSSSTLSPNPQPRMLSSPSQTQRTGSTNSPNSSATSPAPSNRSSPSSSRHSNSPAGRQHTHHGSTTTERALSHSPSGQSRAQPHMFFPASITRAKTSIVASSPQPDVGRIFSTRSVSIIGSAHSEELPQRGAGRLMRGVDVRDRRVQVRDRRLSSPLVATSPLSHSVRLGTPPRWNSPTTRAVANFTFGRDSDEEEASEEMCQTTSPFPRRGDLSVGSITHTTGRVHAGRRPGH